MAYLDEHSNPYMLQYRCPRRALLSGCIIVHTAEQIVNCYTKRITAYQVAHHIAYNQTKPASYHCVVDCDNAVILADDNCETFHTTESDAFGVNMDAHSWSIAFACTAHDLDPDDEWTRKAFAVAGKQIYDFWERNGWEPEVNVRWISRSQAKFRQPGLILHSIVHMAGCYDAWVRHPHKIELDAILLDSIKKTSESEEVS